MHDRKDDEMDALIQYTLKKNDKMDPNLKELSALKLTENVRQYHWHPLASDITGERVQKTVSRLLISLRSYSNNLED